MDVIKQSWKYWKKIWPRMLIIVVAAVLMILITLLTPQISQLIIDKVIYPALGQPLEQQNDSILDFLVAGFSPDNYVGICIMLLSCLAECCCCNMLSTISGGILRMRPIV